MKFSSLLVAALGLVGVVAAPTTFSNLHGDDRRAAIIADVNSKATTWVAGHHERFAGKPFHAIKRQLGVLDIAASEADKLPLEIHTGFDMFGLPEEFDPRDAWPQCKTIREVRDQSDCGSCWAFGAVEAASDRVCIATGGKFQPHLSAQDMLACCSSCGMGCNGGYPSAAWSYLKNTGVVTGGNYNDKSWCSAYSMPNCDHHTTGQYEPCGSHDYPTPACPKQCDADSTYTTPFALDKIRFNSSYSVSRDPTQIMQELMTRGPVEAAFSVYDDFPSYKSGVYQHVSGSYLGGHAIKLLGWGVDKATGAPYWLCANSWNEDWGEQGFFRILRGSNHCGIEGGLVAGQFSA